MIYYRLWCDARGESHIDEIDVEWRRVDGYARGVPPVDLADWLRGGETHFSRLLAGWFGDWHPAPARHVVVLLQGSLQVTTSDGTVMTGYAGTVWLVEDTFGKGHQTRVVGEGDAVRLSVLLAPD